MQNDCVKVGMKLFRILYNAKRMHTYVEEIISHV